MLEILKGIASKASVLLLAWISPAALAVLAFWLITLPMMKAANWSIAAKINQLIAAQEVTWLIGASIVIGILLNSISTSLYRLLEGYSWPEWLRRNAVERQKRKYRDLHAQIEAGFPGQDWERGLALERLSRFPPSEREITPTQLGNAIRAFETYGKDRFNLDSQTLWTELCNVVPKELSSEEELARAFVDLFIASLYLSCAFAALSIIVVYCNEQRTLVDWLTVVVPLVLAAYCYWRASVACAYWSTTVQALVNLGRKPLADSLGLALPTKLSEERKMWGLATAFVYYGYATGYGKKLDRYRSGYRATRSKKSKAHRRKR